MPLSTERAGVRTGEEGHYLCSRMCQLNLDEETVAFQRKTGDLGEPRNWGSCGVTADKSL